MTSVKRTLLGFCIVAASTMSLSAAVMGKLDVANCAGQGVIVTATTIDWLPAGPPTGCIEAGGGTTLTYTGGAVTPGEQGTILDLVAPTAFPVEDFIVFPEGTDPDLSLTLTSFGSGNIAELPQSPFILTQTATGVTVALDMFGTATDPNSGEVSNWVGQFTTQFTEEDRDTIAEILAIIATPGGAIQSTYSGELTMTFNPIPEPGTYALMGAGLVALGWIRRRRSAR